METHGDGGREAAHTRTVTHRLHTSCSQAEWGHVVTSSEPGTSVPSGEWGGAGGVEGVGPYCLQRLLHVSQ